KLVVTFAPTPKPEPLDTLPPPANVEALAQSLIKSGSGGVPTAVIPSRAQLDKWAAAAATKPSWMPDWQWAHVRQLATLSSPDKKIKPFWHQFVPKDMEHVRMGRQVKENGKWVHKPASEEVFAGWVDTLIAKQPRGWYGFESASEMIQWHVFKE